MARFSWEKGLLRGHTNQKNQDGGKVVNDRCEGKLRSLLNILMTSYSQPNFDQT